MKKKLLFIIPSLDSGGAEKSLVNLLNSFDYVNYEVDLVLLRKSGVFLKSVPNQVTIISLTEDYYNFNKNIFTSCLTFLTQLKFSLLFHRLLFTLKNRFISKRNRAEQYSWKHLSKAIQIVPNDYDAAIGYLEKTSIYFCVDCVKASKKIGFIRTDYAQLDLDEKFDFNYFSQLNHLFTNGHISLETLKKSHPKLENKMSMMMNVVSTELIHRMAAESNPLDANSISLVSVGRLDEVKGYDFAIEACDLLIKQGFDLNWTVIGEGNQRLFLEQMIADKKLEQHFKLIGEIENPYPYIANATIYVQTSRFEGRSSTINEAKILAKPIVVTNFNSVFEQIESGKNGIIVDKNATEIANAIAMLLNDVGLQSSFVTCLKNEHLGTETEIQKLYNCINQ